MSLKPISAARVIMTAEASRRFGLTPRAMRYYEERGLIDVDRDWQNRRCYDEAAQQRLARLASPLPPVAPAAIFFGSDPKCG